MGTKREKSQEDRKKAVAITAAWKAKNPDRVRENEKRYRERNRSAIIGRRRPYNRMYNLAKYGLRPGDFEAMLEAQGGVCACCGEKPDPAADRRHAILHVDHDHVTGFVRGLLCHGCNTGIGCFSESPDKLWLAVVYVERARMKYADRILGQQKLFVEK